MYIITYTYIDKYKYTYIYIYICIYVLYIYIPTYTYDVHYVQIKSIIPTFPNKMLSNISIRAPESMYAHVF